MVSSISNPSRQGGQEAGLKHTDRPAGENGKTLIQHGNRETHNRQEPIANTTAPRNAAKPRTNCTACCEVTAARASQSSRGHGPFFAKPGPEMPWSSGSKEVRWRLPSRAQQRCEPSHEPIPPPLLCRVRNQIRSKTLIIKSFRSDPYPQKASFLSPAQPCPKRRRRFTCSR